MVFVHRRVSGAGSGGSREKDRLIWTTPPLRYWKYTESAGHLEAPKSLNCIAFSGSEDLLTLGKDVIEGLSPEAASFPIREVRTDLLDEFLPRLVDLFFEVLDQCARR